jgi:hypothetical protein
MTTYSIVTVVINAKQAIKKNYLLTVVLLSIFVLKNTEFIYQSTNACLDQSVDTYTTIFSELTNTVLL